jgi:hypothetical protein
MSTRPAHGPTFLVTVLLHLTLATAAQETAPAAGAERSAHERMLELLAGIAESTATSNPFMSTQRVEELRAKWAARKGGSAIDRWTIGRTLGNAELEQGNEKEAIEALEAAVAAVDDVPFEKIDRAKIQGERDKLVKDLRNYSRNRTWFDLGMAYLRFGETQNCCLRHSGESCIMPLQGAALHTVEEGSRNAIRCFTEVLRNRPAEPDPIETADCMRRSQWLLNVAYMTLGEYPEKVPAEWLVDIDELFRSEAQFPRFENVLPALELETFDLSGGVIVDDFDGDEYLDILLSCWDTRGPMHFFRNERDGTFADRTKEANLTGFFGGLNMTQADYDDDGDVDVYVPRGAWMREYGKHPHSLLRNDGHAVFTDVSLDAGLERARFPGKTGAWGDYDLDGDLDLYVGFDFGEGYTDAIAQLYRNDGDGTFTECAEEAGVDVAAFVMGATWGDYDNDRWPDLYVACAKNNANDELSKLFHNEGDGTFADVTAAKGVVANANPFPTWFWDYDNDGNLDLYVSCRAGSVEVLADPSLRRCYDSLFRGDGRGGFVDVAVKAGLTHPSLPMGANFGDLDGDGFLDFYLGTGFADYMELHPNVMYLNLRGERFTNVTMAGGFGHLQKGHGVAFADLDTDGDQDVFVQMGGAFLGDQFSDALFENPGFGSAWVALELEGVKENRGAMGARIRVDVVEDGKPRSIHRTVTSGGSYGSSPLRQQIGLGHATAIAQVEILWPVSGAKQVFRDVPPGRTWRIVEGEDELVEIALARTKLGGGTPPPLAKPDPGD